MLICILFPDWPGAAEELQGVSLPTHKPIWSQPTPKVPDVLEEVEFEDFHSIQLGFY